MHNSKLTFFSQIIHVIDSSLVKSVVAKTDANKHSKGFPVWNQLVCMLFCHFSNSHSIRDIVNGMCSTTGNLDHINIRTLPKRSTLSYANQHRDHEVFKEIYLKLFEKLRSGLQGPRIKFKIRSKIYLLDSTIVSLSLKVFDWALYRQRKGAMKIHTLLDYRGTMPEYLSLGEGRENDLIHAGKVPLPKGSVVVADRGYFDFDLLKKWHKDKVRFVVRGRKKMKYEVISSNETASPGILKDQIVKLTGKSGKKKYGEPIRRIEFWDAEKEIFFILLTNVISSWTAETVSNLYKARWEVEKFFKEIKQHVKIKSFIGTSVNAVLIQIWTAMITLLLLKYLKAKARFGWHMSNLVSFIRFNLLVSANLYAWLNEPIFTRARGKPDSVQIDLF